MSIDNFITANNGKYIDVDGAYQAQCWDLVELYAEQVLGVPKEPWSITLGPNGVAYEAWTVFDAHMQRNFDKIPLGQQTRGDINVYGAKPGFPEGHICIDLGAGQVFQQNASQAGSPSHIETRAVSYLLGALRKKGTSMQLTPTQVDKLIKMSLGRPSTPAELNNPDYQKNAGLLTETLWNNGGEARFNNPPTGKFVPYSGPPLGTQG